MFTWILFFSPVLFVSSAEAYMGPGSRRIDDDVQLGYWMSQVHIPYMVPSHKQNASWRPMASARRGRGVELSGGACLGGVVRAGDTTGRKQRLTPS